MQSPLRDHQAAPAKKLSRAEILRRVGTAGGAIALAVASTVTLPAPAPAAELSPNQLQPSERIIVRTPGAVIDGRYVRGSIDVRADNVTIKNTIVEYTGYHSIRIHPGFKGTKIVNSKVVCAGSQTNGIIPGNYTADGVDLSGCRHDFMSSAANPATVTNSTIDGVPYTTAPSSSTDGPTRTSTATLPDTPGRATTATPTTTATPSGFPNASNTGVPAGTSLRTSGSLVVTTPGTVIDGLDVRGYIDIQANNVTVRDSRVSTGSARYPIRVRPGVTGTLIERVEVSNEGSNGKGIYFNSGSGTVRHSNIHSAEDGVFITADNVTVEHNYIHSMARSAGAHPDAIQIRGGDNVTIRHNNLQAIHAQTGLSNAAIQIGSLVGDTITNLRVTDNLMNGGNYTVNAGRGVVDSAVYSGNRFGRDHRYGPVGNIDENSVWASSNVYHDNGSPAR